MWGGRVGGGELGVGRGVFGRVGGGRVGMGGVVGWVVVGGGR